VPSFAAAGDHELPFHALLKNNPSFLESLHRCVAKDGVLFQYRLDAVMVSEIERPSRLVTLAATIVPVSKILNEVGTLTVCDAITDRLVQFVDNDPRFVGEVFMANCPGQEVFRKWFALIFPAFLKKRKLCKKDGRTGVDRSAAGHSWLRQMDSFEFRAVHSS
jgi:hypothetical protein